MEATHLKVFPILSFPSSLNFNRVATLFMYGLQEKLPRSEYTCDMCKAYYMFEVSFAFHTFEVLPLTPSKKLKICKKCAIREGTFKNAKQFNEHFGK